MKKTLYTAILALSIISFFGCKDDTDATQMTLNFEVVLPVSTGQDTLAMGVAQTRAGEAGDPGLAEFFERPKYLYLFLAPGKPTTPGSNPVYYYAIPTSQDEWRRSSDSLVFNGKFSQTVNWDPALKIEDLKEGNLRAYIVASFNEIAFDISGFRISQYKKIESPIVTESDLLDLKFFAHADINDFSKMSLRDIYTTPYNLGAGWTLLDNAMTDRTDYYGTVTNIVGQGNSGIISLKDTLYHLASKVDFQWNSVEQGQNNVMQSIVVNNCPKKGYLFRPTNVVGGDKYSKVLLDNEQGTVLADDKNNNYEARYANADHTDPGNQWSGRAYTYLLQPGTINYTITTSEGGSTNRSSQPDSNGFTNEIFASWYKLNFRIKASN